MLKRSSPAANVNRVMQELALDLSEGTCEVELVGHLPAALNGWADALSRLFAPAPDTKEVPPALRSTPRTAAPTRSRSWWRTLGPAGGGEGGARGMF